MDSSAIELIQETAIGAAKANRLITHEPAIIVGGEIVSIEYLGAGRSRFRGKLFTNSLSDFIAYTVARGQAHGFIDADEMEAKVFFNLGTPDNPGHGDWTALLRMKQTAAYSAMLLATGKQLTQRQLLDFLEDWAGNVRAIDSDGTATSNMGRALAAIRKLTIKATSEATHTEKDFGARKSSIEDIEASADDGMPYGFEFVTEPYVGLSLRTFKLRLSVLTSGDKPLLVLRVISLDSAKESIAQEFKQKLEVGIDDAATLTLGTFTP